MPNTVLLVATVSDDSDCCTLYHATAGSPTSVCPRSSVPLFAGRIAVAAPLSATYSGAKPLPPPIASKPCRAPGCEGAKLTRIWHDEPPNNTAGQPFWSVKSPLTDVVSATD